MYFFNLYLSLPLSMFTIPVHHLSVLHYFLLATSLWDFLKLTMIIYQGMHPDQERSLHEPLKWPSHQALYSCRYPWRDSHFCFVYPLSPPNIVTNPELKVPKFPSPQTEVCLWVIVVTSQLLNGGGEWWHQKKEKHSAMKSGITLRTRDKIIR